MNPQIQPHLIPPRRGFTLIEIMLALLVITIGAVAVIGLLGTSLDTSAKSHDDLNIVGFSDLVLNHCHAVEFGSLPTSGNLNITNYAGEAVALQIGALSAQPFENRVSDADGTIQSRFAVTYQLDIIQTENPDIKTVTLQVYPGYSTNDNPRTFYTEIYNWTDK